MENNTSGPAKGRVSRPVRETCAEPYVGMPIYLDDSFFEFIGEDIGIDCPMQDDMGNMMPKNGRMMPENGRMMPENGRMMPENERMMPGNGGMMPENGNIVNKPNMDTGMPMDCAKGCPLAMAYVPWQQWGETYDMEEGFTVGTIFPCLDLPFLGGAGK